jgi:hypothetical protein
MERAWTTYAGANDTNLAELLAEHEGIELSRVTVRRIVRAGGQPSPRKRRAPRHRSRRDRMAQAGPSRPGRRQPARLARVVTGGSAAPTDGFETAGGTNR